MTETTKPQNKTKIIIGSIIGIIILAIVGVYGYQYYENLKWAKYDKEHNINDNLLTVNCELDQNEEKVISCMVNADVKTSEYDSFSIYIEHSDSVKYLSHNVPTEENIYNSHDTTTYRSENVEDRFFISGIDEIADLEYLLNIKFKVEDSMDNEELNFKYMTIVKDYVDHKTDDVVIKLGELTAKDPNTEAYKYLCLNKDLAKDAVIYKNMLTECTSDKELANGTLTEKLIKEYGLELADTYDDTTYYIKSSKKVKDTLNIEDIYWKLKPVTKENIKSQTGIDYSLSIGEDKALYINSTKIFDKERVKEFYIRPYCCTGGKKLILLTENNNTYMSNDDIDLIISNSSKKLTELTFKNLNITNIKEFHINKYIPSMGGTHVYAIDNNGEEHLID